MNFKKLFESNKKVTKEVTKEVTDDYEEHIRTLSREDRHREDIIRYDADEENKAFDKKNDNNLNEKDRLIAEEDYKKIANSFVVFNERDGGRINNPNEQDVRLDVRDRLGIKGSINGQRVEIYLFNTEHDYLAIKKFTDKSPYFQCPSVFQGYINGKELPKKDSERLIKEYIAIAEKRQKELGHITSTNNFNKSQEEENRRIENTKKDLGEIFSKKED